MSTEPKTREQNIAELADKITTREDLTRAKRGVEAGRNLFRGMTVMTAVSPFLGIWLDWRWWLTAAVLFPMTLMLGLVMARLRDANDLAEQRLNANATEGA